MELNAGNVVRNVKDLDWVKKRKIVSEYANRREPLYFGDFLPIYVNARNGFGKNGKGASTVYGFENGRWTKVPAEKFADQEVIQAIDLWDAQLNVYLIGDDVVALRYAMVLMYKGDPVESLKEIYDLIHTAFSEGTEHKWETIVKKYPVLKERFEKNHPDRQKISKRLFGYVNDEYEQFVQNVRIASIDRVPENRNKNTFDYIQVEVRLSGIIQREGRKILCKKYKKEIGRHILIVLSESPKFLKYSVPVNILKVEKATLGMDATLYVTLGVKTLPEDKEEKV